jgi:hypothetical protein
VYLASANELFKYIADRSIYGRCKLQFTETTAGVYNVCFGFQNAVGADSIVDNTGLPKVTGSCLAIYKTDGSQVWKCVSATNGVATHSTSTKSSTSTAYQDLEIQCLDHDATNMVATFKVDGEHLKDGNNLIIRHFVPIASATEMQVFVGAKLGAATNNDLLLVDYIYAAQRRA